jgi:hypothetical protein
MELKNLASISFMSVGIFIIAVNMFFLAKSVGIALILIYKKVANKCEKK